jgi:hypothetical protein
VGYAGQRALITSDVADDNFVAADLPDESIPALCAGCVGASHYCAAIGLAGCAGLGPGGAGSIGALGSVGITLAPAARAASPVVE